MTGTAGWIPWEMMKTREGERNLRAMVAANTVVYKPDPGLEGLAEIPFPENQLFRYNEEKDVIQAATSVLR